MGKIRIGIAGCGMIARRSHIEGFNTLRGVEVSALYDIDRGKSEECRNSMLPKARVFSDYKEMLESGIDAVCICTPTVFHCGQTLSALSRGLHVFCEKPMAEDLGKATRMVNAARRAGRILHINQSLRYAPNYKAISGFLKKGKLGKLQHVRCIRSGQGTSASKTGWSPGSKWFISKKCGGGVLLDIGVHMADLLKWYGGEVAQIAGDVRNLPGRDGASESAVAVFRFKSGATGVLELKWNLGATSGLLEVYGTEGAIRMGFSPMLIEYIHRGSKWGDARIIEPPKRTKNSLRNFVDAVRGEAVSETPGELGRDAIALCAAIQKSSDSGKFVKVTKWNRN